MKNVTPTYPLPAQGYDLPTRPEPKWKTRVSQATPSALEVLTGTTLLLAYAGTLVLAFCLGMNSAASDNPSKASDRFGTGLILGFGFGWFAARTYQDGSEDHKFGH